MRMTRDWLVHKLSNPGALTDEVWAAWLRLNYRGMREYPSIERQLELIYDDKINGTDLWAAAVLAVKEEYPKPLPTDAETVSVLEFATQPKRKVQNVTIRENTVDK
jgi:hypothetical protein